MAPEDVRGDTDNTEGGDFQAFLAEDAAENGGTDLDEDAVLEGVEKRNSGGRKSPGTDKVLARLAEADPDAAALLKGMQRKMSQAITAQRRLQEQVLELREGKLGGDGKAQEGWEAPAPPPGVTEENLRLFQQMADFLGYVPREEVDQREAGQQASSYVQNALQQGIEMYGDDFGYVDEDGRAVVNPEVAERLERRLQQLQDPKGGITPLDLYVLEMANARGARGETGGGAIRRATGRANVARRSTGGGSRVRIYDEQRGDSTEDVLDRAWVVGKRRLTGGV